MLEIKNLCKTYIPKKGMAVKALDDVSVSIQDKGLIFVLGKSGSGKSTFLNMLGGLDNYDSGEIVIKGKSSKSFSQSDFDSYRNTYVGFIFQEYNILNEFSVGANIGLALQLQGKKATPESIEEILDQVDLSGFANRKPNELSGGQKQRVAIARALIKNPQIILADEPTGALDSKTGVQVFDTLKKLSQEKLIIVVSHDREFAELYADRIIEFADGKITSDSVKSISPPALKSENLTVINKNIIKIKKGAKLTAADLDEINKCIAEGETVISSDERCNTQVNQAAKIDEHGNAQYFREITESEQPKSANTTGEFKSIKSRMPFRNTLKIGASAIKTKPIRLFMTILLSAIAFTLFGIVDTLTAYDNITTTATALTSTGETHYYIEREYKEVYDDYVYYNQSPMSEGDFDEAKELFGLSSGLLMYDQYLTFSESCYDYSVLNNRYYNNTSLYDGSIATCSDAELSSVGLELLVGELPTTKYQIVIPSYIYDVFKTAGVKLADGSELNIAKPEDILWNSVSISIGDNTNTYEICGVLDDGLNSDGKFNALKSGDNTKLESQLRDELTSTIHSCIIVSKELLNETVSQNQLFDIDIDINNSTTGIYWEPIETIPMQGDYYFKDSSKTKLSSNDVVIDCFTARKASGFDGYDKPYVSPFDYDDIIDFISDTVLDYLKSNFNIITFPNNSDEYVSAAEVEEKNKTFYDTFANYIGNYEFEGATYISLSSIYYNLNVGFTDDFKEIYLGKDNLYDLVNDHVTSSPLYESALKTLAAELDNIGREFSLTAKYNTNYDRLEEPIAFNLVAIIKPTLSDYDKLNYAGQGHLYVNEELYDSLYDIFGVDREEGKRTAKAFIVNLGNNESTIKSVLKTMYDQNGDYRYALANNSTLKDMETTSSMISQFGKIFLIVSIVCLVLAVLLMMNFIAVSITQKKREIGVLRAVGARSADVFWIFFVESMIIALINAVIAAVGAGLVVSLVLNPELSKVLAISASYLNFGIRQIVIIVASSIAVATLASLGPVMSLARKKPIDTIRKAD